MDRVFTKWHEQVQLSVAAGVEMAKQRPPDSGNASLLLSSRESQLGYVHWIDPDAAPQEEKVWVLESVWSGSTRVGWEVRVFDAKRTPIDFHSIDFSLVLADVGIAMEKARKARRPKVPAKALRLHDMSRSP